MPHEKFALKHCEAPRVNPAGNHFVAMLMQRCLVFEWLATPSINLIAQRRNCFVYGSVAAT